MAASWSADKRRHSLYRQTSQTVHRLQGQFAPTKSEPQCARSTYCYLLPFYAASRDQVQGQELDNSCVKAVGWTDVQHGQGKVCESGIRASLCAGPPTAFRFKSWLNSPTTGRESSPQGMGVDSVEGGREMTSFLCSVYKNPLRRWRLNVSFSSLSILKPKLSQRGRRRKKGCILLESSICKSGSNTCLSHFGERSPTSISFEN